MKSFWGRVSWKGVIIGTLVNVVPSDVIGIIVMLALLAGAHWHHVSPDDLQALNLQFIADHPWLSQLLQMPGALFSVLGGYVAARIAKRHELLNATLTSLWCAGSMIWSITVWSSLLILPIWVDIITIFLNILLALLGGLIYLRLHGRYAANTGVESKSQGPSVALTHADANRVAVGLFIGDAWEIFKKRPWFLIGVEVALFVIMYLIGMVSALIQLALLARGWPITGSFIALLFNFALQVLFPMAMIGISLKAYDSIGTTRFADAWRPEVFWRFLGATFLYYMAMIAGTLLFVIPGIIASVAFMFAPFLVIDKGLGPIAALKESARITKGNRWRMIALMAAIMLLSFLGFLALIVGSLVVMPVYWLSMASAYRRLSAAADANQPPRSLTGGEIGCIVGAIVAYILAFALFIFIASKITPGGIYAFPAEQPAASIAPLNAVRMPFTTFVLINNTPKIVTISGVTVQASKMKDQATIGEVELVDENGLELGPAQRLDTSGKATLGGGFILFPMSSTTITVAANIASCEHACADSGQVVNINVIGISASSSIAGVMPIAGTGQTINPNLKIGTVSAETIGSVSTSTNLQKDQDVKLLSTRFTAGPQEDLMLYSLRYKYDGTLDFNKLSNVQATVAGKNYPAAVMPLDKTYFTVTFPGGLPLVEGNTLTVTLHGSANTDGQQGKFVRFDVEDPADMYFVGQTYGYGVMPSGGLWQAGRVFEVSQ